MNPEAIKAAALSWERGRALQKAGRYHEAEPLLRAALKVMPNTARLLADYAQLAEQLGDWKAAATMWRKVAAADPSCDVDDAIGLALLQQKRNEEALPLLEGYVRRHPGHGDANVNLAAALTRLEREPEAIASLRRALQANPALPLAWEALATLCINGADVQGATATLAEGRRRYPDSIELRFLEMDHRLKNREFAAGFDAFDLRWHTRFFTGAGSIVLPGERRWDGRPFDGTLLVRAEQGLGDELLYSSLLPDLARLQPGSVIECEPRLLPLYTRTWPALRFISRYLPEQDPARPAWDRDTMAGDLCRLFRRAEADFPTAAGWLQANGERTAELRADYDRRFGKALRVGLSWRSKHPEHAGAKSIALTDLLPVLQVPGVTFFDIQYGDTQADRDTLRAQHGIEVLRDERVDPLADIEGLAAQLSALDLVISTSNSTVHLAGALGRPTLVMLHRDRGLPWYWAYEGEQVPWYPNTRLLRCPARRAWSPVIAEAAVRLQQLAAGTGL